MAKQEREINHNHQLDQAIFTVRTRILKNGAFRLNGKDHSVNLHPVEIIKSLEELILDPEINLTHSQREQIRGFIEDGFSAIYSISPNESFVNKRRRQALRLLGHACSQKVEKIAASNKNRHLEESIEPYVGIQLAVTQETDPDKFTLLERSNSPY